MTTWAEKYRPKSLRDVVGNPTAVADLERWARSWEKGRPDRRAVILAGPPGTGKTSAAIALANDMGWTVVEMNASDRRNAESVRQIALRGATAQTFSDSGEFLTAAAGGRKLVLLDEADNLIGRQDTGGIGAIVDTIRRSGQPIVLIANDYYELTRRSSSIRSLCRTIKFKSIHPSSAKLSGVGAKVSDTDLPPTIPCTAIVGVRTTVKESLPIPVSFEYWTTCCSSERTSSAPARCAWSPRKPSDCDGSFFDQPVLLCRVATKVAVPETECGSAETKR